MSMRFFSHQTIANTNSNIPPNTMFFMPVRPHINRIQQPQQSISSPPPFVEPPKKVKWGAPVWFLLHTLSIKIKDSEFKNLRKELLDRVYAICINLPCPDCANHAKAYLDGINFNAIQTKEDFKQMLHTFHNTVNKRKGYAFFPYDQLEEKYSTAITTNIIRNFMMHFSDRNRSFKLVASDLHRAQLCKVLKEWFNERIQCFDP